MNTQNSTYMWTYNSFYYKNKKNHVGLHFVKCFSENIGHSIAFISGQYGLFIREYTHFYDPANWVVSFAKATPN